jgi:hypothetical protein
MDDGATDFSGEVVVPYGYTDAYLAAYTPAGTLDWVQHYGAAASRSLGSSLLAEPGRTVLFAGVASEKVDLGQGPLSSASGFGDHLFIMRMNAAGEQQALKTVYVEYGQVFDIAQRADGGVVILGTYRGTRQFDGFSLQGGAGGDMFLATLSPDLSTFERVESFSTPREDFSFGHLAVLSDDSIAVALDFQRWIDVRGARYMGGEGWMTLVTIL